MKNILLIILFVIVLNMNLLANIDKEFINELNDKQLYYVYEHANTHNIDNFTISVYPYKIMFAEEEKDFKTNTRIKYNDCDIYNLIKNYKKYDLKEYDIDNKTYKSIIYKNPNQTGKSTDNYLLLTNDNKILWDCSFDNAYNDSYIIDIKKYNDGLIILYYNRCYIYVDYVYNNILPIIEHYGPIGPVIFGETIQLLVNEGNIISNNIIRLKYKNTDQIEYWKIKITKSDYDNFEIIKNDKTLKINFVDQCQLLWYNNALLNRKNIYKYSKNYDYFKQDTEPTIEQLKEKFPDDTFFGDTVGDKEDNTFSENVYKNKDENIESPKQLFVRIYDKCKKFFVNLKNKWQV